MTKIIYTHTPTYFSIDFRGHAGYAPEGQDIVCAAVSMLASELLYACEQAQRKGEIADYAHSQSSASVSARFFYRRNESMRQIVNLILASLKMVEQEYADYVQLRASSPIDSQVPAQ